MSWTVNRSLAAALWGIALPALAQLPPLPLPGSPSAVGSWVMVDAFDVRP